MKICDSIAIKVLEDNKILRGIGNSLYYHTETSSNELEWKLVGKIHGIDFFDKTFLVYGAKEFMILTYSNDSFHLFSKNSITDWISKGKLLQNKKVYLLTGHLVLISLIISESTRKCNFVRKISCEDKSTLYCSLLHGDKEENLLAFGGTACEVIIWQPFSNSIIGRVSGNNGVILSIDLKYNLLITTSDDRSIKFYDIFFDKNDLTNKINKCKFKTSFIQGFAHTSRVFKGKIIDYDQKPIAISVGEDSTVCVWDRFGKLILRKQNHHYGSTIWNVDYDYKNKIIWTVGGDGNLFNFSIKDLFEDNLEKKPGVLQTTFTEFEYMNKIRFLETYHMIGITNKNNILLCKQNAEWKTIKTIENFFKPTVLEVFNDLVAIGGYKRFVILKFKESQQSFEVMFDDEVVDGVIRSVCLLSLNEFLICNEIGNVKILNVIGSTIRTFTMPTCKEPWITSSLKIEDFLIVSNRLGTLYLYSIDNNDFVVKTQLKKVNGNLGITTIKLIKNHPTIILFKTYGHDNTVKLIKLHKLNKTMEIVARQPCSVAWVEKVFFHDQMEFCVGFNSTEFLVWEKKHNSLIQINCGGGHRYWDCKINFFDNKFKLIFIKKSQIHFVENNLIIPSENILRIPRFRWHYKSCNTIKCLKNFIISAGEDNIIKFSCYINDILTLKHEIFTHISSIKTISIQLVQKSKYFIFSGGGRAQICVTKFNLLKNYFEEKHNFMLKSTDFNRKYIKNLQEIDFDPEMRIMSLDVIKNENLAHFDIYTGCSDGYIRKFIYKNNIIQFSDEFFYNKCILDVKIIFSNILCSTSTDGSIQFWNILEFNGISIFQLKHHNNGIKSFDITCKDNYIYIITGGDDQNVVISIIEICDNIQFKLLETKTFNNLHTAQVTGVKFSKNIDFFYSTSVDQTVCKVTLENYELIKKVSSNIPDIKGLEIIDISFENDINCIVVYGCGIESFNF